MVFRLFGRSVQGLDDEIRGGQIRIADAQGDDVHALAFHFRLEPVDFGEPRGGKRGHAVGESKLGPSVAPFLQDVVSGGGALLPATRCGFIKRGDVLCQ